MKSFKKKKYVNESKNKYHTYKGNPPIIMDKDLDDYASEVFYLIKARNCALACVRYVLIGE
jgi:hypothetical protein